jgi:hypothetical protein
VRVSDTVGCMPVLDLLALRLRHTTWWLVLATSVLALQAQADVTYRYTGNLFDTIQDPTPPAGSYDTSMRVEISLTFAQPIPPDVPLYFDFSSDVLAFRFEDGRHVITDSSGGSLEQLHLATNAEGSIIGWSLQASDPATSPTTPGEQQVIISAGHSFPDAAAILECCSGANDIATASSPGGTWERIPTEPYVVYDYEGNLFDTIQDQTPPAGSYEISMRVEISLTFAQPIPPDTPLTDFSSKVLAFRFEDGRHVITDATGGKLVGLQHLATDAEGSIDEWIVQVTDPATSPTIPGEPFVGISATHSIEDLVFVQECCGGAQDFATAPAPGGTWEETLVDLPPSVPALPSLSLVLLAGILALGGMRASSRQTARARR